MKIKSRFAQIVVLTSIVVVDIFIYLFLGTLLMGYDDNYDDSKGEYWSLSSMTTHEKIIYICYNSWIVLNMIGIVYIGYKFYKRQIKHR